MAQMTMVKCTNCGKQIDSLGESELICRYCGKKTVVEDEKDDTDFMRRAQIFNLEDDIKNEMFGKKICFLLAGLTLAVGLFLTLAVNTNIFFMILSLVLLLVWFGFGYVHHSKLDKLKSKKFDLAGGKLLSDY